MTDHELIRSCDEAVQRERDALTDVLRHLREIERRRLFSELNYKSLFDYCVRRLGYSEDQAYRRINAMRLIKQMPEAEEKIEQGSLSLSNASLLQKTISNRTLKIDGSSEGENASAGMRISKSQMLELINRVENKSRREAKKILTHAKTIFHIQAQDDETVEFFEALKGLTAHQYRNVPELFKAMVILSLNEKYGLLPRKSSLAQKQRIMAEDRAGNRKTLNFADFRCTRCGSLHAPQEEHIIPRAKGGTNDPENLTLLCRNCNQRAAIREFGLKKMDRYLNR